MSNYLLNSIDHISVVGRLMNFLTWADTRYLEERDPHYTEIELRLIEIARKTNSLMAVFYRLNKILAFLSFDELPLKTPLFNITRSDWLDYHEETFFWLTIAFQDRALRLTNEAIGLGLSSIQCRHDKILNEIEKSHPQVSNGLLIINNCVSQYRNRRNLIVHEGNSTDFGTYSLFQAASSLERYGVKNIDCDSFDYMTEFINIRDELVKTVNNFGNQAINASEILLNALEPSIENLFVLLRQ